MALLDGNTILPPSVERPGYDRAALRPGIVHLGLGAFHRAHQALYTDRALEARFGDWGIVGASLRSTDIAAGLKAQDCLYSVVTRGPYGDSVRVVGSVVDAVAASDERDRLLGQLASSAIRIVTLTVSEKAYGIDPVSGGLDLAHAVVAHDLQEPEKPIGTVGLLVEGLRRRMLSGSGPLTVLCCDNLPGNGHVLRRLVLEMAERRGGALAAWIGSGVRFPCSMVDRIVPAATGETRARAAGLIEAEDRFALETEPFSQWVIEDDFAAGRPEWEAGGALFVADVAPYEKMKLRLLNGSHSLIAYLGQLHGLDCVRDVMAVAAHGDLVRRHMTAVLPTLDPLPEIDLAAYCEQLVARFANPAIAHRTAQIAMDGTQKMPLRVFAPAVEALSAGGDGDSFALATAYWLAYVVRADRLDDPRAGELRAAAAVASPGRASAPFLELAGLFPAQLLEDRSWRFRVDDHMRAILGS